MNRRCRHCGTEFEAVVASRRHCSAGCAYQHKLARQLARLQSQRDAARAVRPPLAKQCPACGSQFQARQDRAVYCSPDCRRQQSAARRALRYAKRKAMQPPAPKRPCRICGEPLESIRGGRRQHTRCTAAALEMYGRGYQAAKRAAAKTRRDSTNVPTE